MKNILKLKNVQVLITGSDGFIGRNLCQHLKEIKNVKILHFNKEDSFSVIKNNIKNIDFIFHLAGVNRPDDVKEFYKGNTDLTRSIVRLLKENKLNIPIIMTSSVQAVKDNDYGKSKKLAEDILVNYKNSYIYRLSNVFGKWCKPNYNSVVATFCYNISHDINVIINDENVELELIYIDDVIKDFLNILKGNKPRKKDGNFYYIEPIYKTTVGDLAIKIKSLKNNIQGILVPQTGDEFIKKLFSTYISYVELDDMVFTPKMNIDKRGSFTELIKTVDCGQISVSISKPGVFRGNHYHNTKMEKFIVIKGSAKITFKNIITGDLKEYLVDDKKIKIVNIPVGYTHKIENIGKDEMVLLLWCNEIFNSSVPDTYLMEIK